MKAEAKSSPKAAQNRISSNNPFGGLALYPPLSPGVTSRHFRNCGTSFLSVVEARQVLVVVMSEPTPGDGCEVAAKSLVQKDT